MLETVPDSTYVSIFLKYLVQFHILELVIQKIVC